jgi:hypothetical protein
MRGQKAGPLLLMALVLQSLGPTPAHAGQQQARDEGRTRYAQMVQRVAAMAQDAEAMRLARRDGLDILNVLWEDTGRYQGSSVGPNISDVTIEVEMPDGRGGRQTALMPVLRFPNFTDKTGDVAIDRIWLPVGNQVKGHGAQRGHVSLKDFLAQPTRYLSLPQQGTIRGGSLLAQRDSHALVSAQATFLPIPADGGATFWPVIFNYQSTKDDPAVLTLLVTRQGTSVAVIDNARDTVAGGRSWGQRLYFNSGGERAPLTAERLSTVKDKGITANGEAASSLGADANLLMIIQVPLKTRPRRRAMQYSYDDAMGAMASAPPPAPAASAAPEAKRAAREESNVEVAVLGHGPQTGPYTELGDVSIERDPRFPVRVTVQFYQATSNGVVSAGDVKTLAAQIGKVYASADYVGSLVVPDAGDRKRPTNWDGVGPLPPGTRCEDFPALLARRLCRPGQTGVFLSAPRVAGIQ